MLKTFSYKITGQTDAAEGSSVALIDPENKMQQFAKTKVANGQFVLEGELAMTGFYTVQVNDGATYTLFLEGNSDYDLKENKGLFTLTTTSDNAMDFLQFTAKYRQREKDEKLKTENRRNRIGTLNGQLADMAARNDGSYEKTIDEIQSLSAIKPYDLRDLYADFILDSMHRSSLVLPYFFKYVSIDQDNFKKFDGALERFDATLQKHPYYKFAREKVDRVSDFYQNMPVFPTITPMNVQRDSLRLREFSNSKMLIVAFWKASSKYSVSDVTVLRKKEPKLNAIGVRVIYFSLDSDQDAWIKSSNSLALGLYNYYLNTNDRATMENDFGIDRAPSYLWINPQTFKILSLTGEDPTLPSFVGKVKEFLMKN
ncbi:MAG: hypothetical protein LBF27_05465 [Sphingobacterium sp.]|nr:hypothetical protein [Sphingobacterium sp.]